MADPIIARTVAQAAGLREGGPASKHEVLASYRSDVAGDVSALCQHGLLLREDDGWRYIDNGDIEAVRLPMEVKESREARRLILVLTGGERVEVVVDGERDGFLDVFPIHAFLRRRIHQHKAFSRTTRTSALDGGRSA